MKYAMVGFGGMGRAVDEEAARRGHERTACLTSRDVSSAGPTIEQLAGAEIAFEFTRSEAAENNVVAMLRAGVAVICGTTGWEAGATVDEALAGADAALVIAPNFSIGVQCFFLVAERASRIFAGVSGYDPFLVESHHRDKRDAPSGTARRLARIVIDNDPRLEGLAEGVAHQPGRLPVATFRAGGDPGTHTLGFDGAHDVVTLKHVARSRAGFARGAVSAAEWVRGRAGRQEFDALLREQLRAQSSKAREGKGGAS